MRRTKRWLTRLLAFALVLTTVPMYGTEAKAGEEISTEGDYSFKVNEDGNSVTIVGYAGNGEEIKIPSEIDGKKVTGIGNSAFSGCRGLTRVEIPEGVTSIGEHAFSYCGLTSVEIPEGVTVIGGSAFYDCSSLTSVTIPESVRSIGFLAFYGCGSLSEICVDSGNSVYDSRMDCNAIIETAAKKLIRGGTKQSSQTV